MRIIAGKLKGQRLNAVPGNTTRPTADKVREAVFQVLGPFFDGGECLDLFAGSGSLGIEAISRGIEKAIFIDKHPKAIRTIHENLRVLKIEEQAEVYRTDAKRAIHAVAKRGLAFDLILLDPPYQHVDYSKILQKIDNFCLSKENGMVYCEHDVMMQLPDRLDRFRLVKKEHYGKTIGVTIYQRE